jgi:hypothetical protein
MRIPEGFGDDSDNSLKILVCFSQSEIEMVNFMFLF